MKKDKIFIIIIILLIICNICFLFFSYYYKRKNINDCLLNNEEKLKLQLDNLCQNNEKISEQIINGTYGKCTIDIEQLDKIYHNYNNNIKKCIK